MKLSTRARYGLRALVEMASAPDGAPVSVRLIAKRQAISPKYLEQIIHDLRAAGLVNASRGFHGGCTLARPAGEINLMEVYGVLEGSSALVDCVGDPAECRRSNACPTRDVWRDMGKAMEKVLSKTTLLDLVERNADPEAAAFYEI